MPINLGNFSQRLALGSSDIQFFPPADYYQRQSSRNPAANNWLNQPTSPKFGHSLYWPEPHAMFLRHSFHFFEKHIHPGGGLDRFKELQERLHPSEHFPNDHGPKQIPEFHQLIPISMLHTFLKDATVIFLAVPRPGAPRAFTAAAKRAGLIVSATSNWPRNGGANWQSICYQREC